MSYVVKQIRNGNIGKSPYDSINVTLTTSIDNISEIAYENNFISFDTGVEVSECYFVKFKVEQDSKYAKTIYIKLANKDNYSEYMQICKFTIPKSPDTNTHYSEVSFAFQNTKTFSWQGILVELGRNPDNNKSETKANISYVSVQKVNNLVKDYADSFVQLGIQAHPGFNFIINGESMQVGRTGIFETQEGYQIDYLGIIPKIISNDNNTKVYEKYIIDYRYEKGAL